MNFLRNTSVESFLTNSGGSIKTLKSRDAIVGVARCGPRLFADDDTRARGSAVGDAARRGVDTRAPGGAAACRLQDIGNGSTADALPGAVTQ
jgi:hypothetical protein